MSEDDAGVDVTAITAHGQKAADNATATNDDVVKRLEALELAIEQAGQQSQLVVDIGEYVGRLSKESLQLGLIRYAALGVSLCFLLGLNYTVFDLLFWRPLYFYFLGPTTRVAIITSVVAGSIFLLTVVLKGVFRTIADRHAEDTLPPHLQALVELAKNTLKPGS